VGLSFLNLAERNWRRKGGREEEVEEVIEDWQ